MDAHSPEYLRAQTLDKITKILANYNRGKQMLSTMLATHASIPDSNLDKLLSEEPKYFQQSANSASRMAYGNASMVELTPFGEQQFKGGWTFTKQLEQDQMQEMLRKQQEQTKKKWAWIPKSASVFFAICTLVLGYLTMIATRENKLHNDKEERWEAEKRELHSKYDQLSKVFYTIPDSIRSKYE